jgi:hypothetical protein
VQRKESTRIIEVPWKNKPLGVVSLEELLGYSAETMCALSDIIGRVAGVPLLVAASIIKNPNYMMEISHRISYAKKLSQEHGWTETVSRLAEIEVYIEENRIAPAVFQSKLADLQTHVNRVLKENLFFHVDKTRMEEYFEWNTEARVWRDIFPTPYFELTSAVECYLFGQPVAAVFHSMRALEVALQTFAQELIVPFDREQWENLINNIEAKIKTINGPHAGADWKKKQELYSEAALHFRYLKNAWRNHVMHVRHDYDKKTARTIWQHATDFVADLGMRVGLKELKPQPKTA